MTKRRAAILVLQHGPLSFQDFELITGWSYRQCYQTLRDLWQEGVVHKPSRGIYAVR